MEYHIQEMPGARTYDKNGLSFPYLEPDTFKSIQRNAGAKVVGSVRLKEARKVGADMLVIESHGRAFEFEVEKDVPTSGVQGYVRVLTDSYVAVKKGAALPLALIALSSAFILGAGLVFFMAGRSAPSGTGTDPADLEIANGQDWDGKLPQNGELNQASSESIEIPGYAEMHLDAGNKEIQLINPKGNTVYFVYEIKDEGGKTIYESKAIEANKAVNANLYDALGVGEHKLSFVISTYDVKTKASCNGATQDVIVIVK